MAAAAAGAGAGAGLQHVVGVVTASPSCLERGSDEGNAPVVVLPVPIAASKPPPPAYGIIDCRHSGFASCVVFASLKYEISVYFCAPQKSRETEKPGDISLNR